MTVFQVRCFSSRASLEIRRDLDTNWRRIPSGVFNTVLLAYLHAWYHVRLSVCISRCLFTYIRFVIYINMHISLFIYMRTDVIYCQSVYLHMNQFSYSHAYQCLYLHRFQLMYSQVY